MSQTRGRMCMVGFRHGSANVLAMSPNLFIYIFANQDMLNNKNYDVEYVFSFPVVKACFMVPTTTYNQ